MHLRIHSLFGSTTMVAQNNGISYFYVDYQVHLPNTNATHLYSLLSDRFEVCSKSNLLNTDCIFGKLKLLETFSINFCRKENGIATSPKPFYNFWTIMKLVTNFGS